MEKLRGVQKLAEKPLIIITGPTATGKTHLSIKLAEKLDGEIISADSMQVYRGLDVGTDKASKEDLKAVKHYLIDILNPNEAFNAAKFAELADEAIRIIRKKEKYPIVVGGTGFYIDALLFGIPKMPNANKALREDLNKLTSTELHRRLSMIDMQSAERIHPNDRKRIIRAIEIYTLTGKPISSFQVPKNPRYTYLGYFLYRNREELYRRIEERIYKQLKNGLISETRMLLNYDRSITALQALGYKEMLEYLDGKITKREAVGLLIRRTKRFAKRQFTWFRKRHNFRWINLSNIPEDKAIGTIKEDLRRNDEPAGCLLK